MKKTPIRSVRRPRHSASESARKAVRTAQSLPEQGHCAASPPAVPAILTPQVLPAITASLDLPVGPEGLIDSVSAKFERFVMEQTAQQQTDLLVAWRKKLAEIPYVQRQAKAHLTDVLLQQTEPGRQLYQTLQGQFQVQQLRPVPDAYRQYLPDVSRLDWLRRNDSYGFLILPVPVVPAGDCLTEQVQAAVA